MSDETARAAGYPSRGGSPPPGLTFDTAIHDGAEVGLLYDQEARDEAWILAGPGSFQEVRDAR